MYSPTKQKNIQRIIVKPRNIIIYGKRTIIPNKKEYIKK